MTKGSWKMVTNEGRRNNRPVRSRRLGIVSRPHKICSIVITKNRLIKDIHHNKVREESFKLERSDGPFGKDCNTLRTLRFQLSVYESVNSEG